VKFRGYIFLQELYG